jgi:glycosyltransferase involved in cell wall biosynthesis
MSNESYIGIDLRMYSMAGIGRYLRNLLPGLIPRLDASRIVVLGLPGDLASERWMSDPRIQFAKFGSRIFSANEQWASLTGKYRTIDLLWAPQYNIPLLYRGKLVVTIHDLCQLAHPETLGSELQRRYSRFLLTHVAKRATKILCVSEFTAMEVHQELKVDMERLIVTYPPMTKMSSESILVQAPLCSSPFLLTVGNIKKHKNLPRLIAAYDRIKNQIPHDLIVVGKQDGFRNSETDFRAVLTDLGGRVRFTGHVSDLDLQRYYKEAEALIFPSFYEGFGFPLVEAMLAGCPIACSNVSSLPEVAGEAALLFDPFNVEDVASALLRIATDAALRSALVERGRHRVKQYVGDLCAEHTAAVINSSSEEHRNRKDKQ